MSPKFKNALWTVALASMVCLPSAAMAQDAKIAVVDTQALTLACDEGKAVNDKLEKRFQAISAEMDKLRKDIENKEETLQKQDRIMSATAKTQLARDIDDAKRTFDRKNQDYQKELADMQNELLAPVAAKAQEALAAFVKESGYTLLIDISSEKSNVVWAHPKNDVTPIVLQRLNEAYKASGGASAQPATPAPAPKPAPAPAAAPARGGSSTPTTTPATPATPPRGGATTPPPQD